MKMMQTNLFGLLLILPFLFIDCTHSVSEPEEKEMPPPCKALCGQAFLQGYIDHGDIRVVNLNTGASAKTGSKGNFELPLPVDGRYTLIAIFPTFINDTVSVEVKDSTIVKSPRMTLIQYLRTSVIPDTIVLFINDSLRFNVKITNLFGRVMQGPDFRVDQIWLRDAQDTTKIFQTYFWLRIDPNATSYMPLETKIFRNIVAIRNYRPAPPAGIYQAWLADRFYVDPGQPFIVGGTFSFGDSFNPAKGWTKIQIQ